MSYISLHKNQLLDALENHALYADLGSVIVGQKGLGKSFFIEKLIKRLAGQVHPAQILAQSDLTPPQLEKAIVLQLGLSWQNQQESLLDKIREKLEQRVLLTVDDAHLLSIDCLEYLMRLVSQQFVNKDTCIFVVLLGQQSLARKLSETSPLAENPNICAVFELQPIQENETKYFIAEFQAIDLGTTEALYDAQKLHYFWQLSNGNPGDIDYQLNRWLAESNLPKQESNTLQPSKKYWLSAAYAVLAVVLLTILVYQDEINRSVAGDSVPLTIENGKVVVEESTKPSSVPDKVSDSRKSKQIIDESVESDVQQYSSAQKKNSLAETQEIITKQKLLNPPVNESVGDDLKDPVISQQKSIAETQAAIIESSKARVEKKLEEKVEVQPVTTKTPPVVDKLLLTDEEKQLNGFADSQFTLQWVGVSSLKAAEAFRDKHPLKQQMLIYRRKQTSGYLYLVVTGQFNNRDDAEHTRIVYLQRDYPGKAWIKSLKAVKQEISTLRN